MYNKFVSVDIIKAIFLRCDCDWVLGVVWWHYYSDWDLLCLIRWIYLSIEDYAIFGGQTWLILCVCAFKLSLIIEGQWLFAISRIYLSPAEDAIAPAESSESCTFDLCTTRFLSLSSSQLTWFCCKLLFRTMEIHFSRYSHMKMLLFLKLKIQERLNRFNENENILCFIKLFFVVLFFINCYRNKKITYFRFWVWAIQLEVSQVHLSC